MCVVNNDREAKKSFGGLTFRKARAYGGGFRILQGLFDFEEVSRARRTTGSSVVCEFSFPSELDLASTTSAAEISARGFQSSLSLPLLLIFEGTVVVVLFVF